MPLSQPVARREACTPGASNSRATAGRMACSTIEARLTDTKSYGFATDDRPWIDPGEPLHGMSMRMTVDEDMTIVGFEASTDYSPYRICPEIAPNYAKLVGIRIGRGFMRAVAERVGGTHGCTHLRELLQPMATVAFQTLYPVRARRDREAAGRKATVAQHLLRVSRRRPDGAAEMAGACRRRRPAGQRRCRDGGGVRRGRGRRRDGRVHRRRPPVGRSIAPGDLAGGRAAGPRHLDPHPGRLCPAVEVQALRLGLRHRTRARAERPQHRLAARPGAGRLRLGQRAGVPARLAARLRPLGAGRGAWLGVGRRAAGVPPPGGLGRGRPARHAARAARCRSASRGRCPCGAAAFIAACQAGGLSPAPRRQ